MTLDIHLATFGHVRYSLTMHLHCKLQGPVPVRGEAGAGSDEVGSFALAVSKVSCQTQSICLTGTLFSISSVRALAWHGAGRVAVGIVGRALA